MTAPTLATLRARIAAETGIELGPRAVRQLERALERLAPPGTGTPSVPDDLLETTPAGSILAELVSAVTVNETYFWRVPNQFEALRDEVLPGLARGRTTPLRLWSAGCSTGPEAYSLVIAAEQAGLLASPGIRVTATDVDEDALRLARAARYGSWSMRGVDDDMRRRWFTVEEDGSHRPVARVRGPVEFRRGSITEPWLDRPVDVVCCRNVLMYFDTATRERAVANLHDALVPGGYLFVAPAELQPGLFDAFEQQPLRAGAVALRRPQRDRPRRSTPSPARRRPARPAAPRRRATAKTPTPPPPEADLPALLDRGLALLDAGDGATSVSVLRSATVLCPTAAGPHAALALALLHEGEDARAAAAARTALRLLDGSEDDDEDARVRAVVVLTTLGIEAGAGDG